LQRPPQALPFRRMMWRAILTWLLGLCLAQADYPRHFSVISVASCKHSTLQFDANGNLTNDGTRVFSYDAENRLTNVLVANQSQTTFIYDGLNRRRVTLDSNWVSGAWVKTNETRYICDGMLVLQERNSNNIPTATYTRGLDLSQA
jgi:YD repeat-containing protein